MPKKTYTRRRRKRSKDFVAIPFEAEIALLALADNVVLKGDIFSAVLGEDLYVISIDGTWTTKGHTALEGPISVGFAHDDLSVGEIAEATQAELTDPDDIIQKERARRPVRKVGAFVGFSSNEVLNNGVPIRQKMKISVGDGHNVSMWAENRSGAPLTTGTLVQCTGTLYGRWQR